MPEAALRSSAATSGTSAEPELGDALALTPACPRWGPRVTLPRMLIVFLAALVVGFLTLIGGLFVTPEWD